MYYCCSLCTVFANAVPCVIATPNPCVMYLLLLLPTVCVGDCCFLCICYILCYVLCIFYCYFLCICNSWFLCFSQSCSYCMYLPVLFPMSLLLPPMFFLLLVQRYLLLRCIFSCYRWSPCISY
jgi:hypothetical protein